MLRLSRTAFPAPSNHHFSVIQAQTPRPQPEEPLPDSMANEASWHVLTAGGEQMGPYTDDELRTYAGEGRITPENLLWAEGMEDWVPAAQVEGLFPAPQARAPMLVTGAVQPTAHAQATAPVAVTNGLSTRMLLSAPYSRGGSLGTHPAGATFDPVFVKPLRAVALGLSFLLWGTWGIAVGFALGIFGVLWVFFANESRLGLVFAVVGGASILVGYVLKITGASISINVPSASSPFCTSALASF